MNQITRHTLIVCAPVLLLAPLAAIHAAEPFLVENGQPRAEIVIAEKPQRTARLAAQDPELPLDRLLGTTFPARSTGDASATAWVRRHRRRIETGLRDQGHDAYAARQVVDLLALRLRRHGLGAPRGEKLMRPVGTLGATLGALRRDAALLGR